MPGTTELELKNMILRDNFLNDKLEDSKYTVSEKPHLKLIENRKTADLYAVDEGKGCTVSLNFDRDPSTATLKTNPAMLNDIVQGGILQEAFKIKPEAKQILASLIFGGLFGFVFGLMF